MFLIFQRNSGAKLIENKRNHKNFFVKITLHLVNLKKVTNFAHRIKM